MTRRPRVGLLPLYLKLYDDTRPENRSEFRPLIGAVTEGFASRGVECVAAEVCRLAGEVAPAVARFEEEAVDLVVTLHLAYSPSLESADALVRTRLPVLILDTTMDFDFGPSTDPARIMFNHGIHGVMDLASVLRRRGKAFRIVAGHVTESPVLDRASHVARASYGARRLRGMKALRIGESFAGMGDFAVDAALMREALGVEVAQAGLAELAASVGKVSSQEVETEIERDRELYTVEAPREVHERSVRVGLGLRRMLEEGDYGAFSMNFLAFDRDEGPVDTVPFLEASKAMARGTGYAGEGDCLTASLVGALAAGFGRTTFTEIFCPDWKGGALFLSHMGEVNPEVAAERPRLVEKPFPFTPAQNPAILAAAPAAGEAVFCDMAPGPEDTLGLIISPVQILEDAANPSMRDSVRGWMRPSSDLAEFLEAYSRRGGTHHSALVLGAKAEAMEAFAAFAGIECVCI